MGGGGSKSIIGDVIVPVLPRGSFSFSVHLRWYASECSECVWNNATHPETEMTNMLAY